MKKQIKLTFYRFIEAICLIFLLLWGCEKSTAPDDKVLDTNKYIRLENQTDHSGVLIKILETNAMAITDSMGSFILPKIADGEYKLQAKYPFFIIIEKNIFIADSVLQTEIEIELEQQLQFWVEPAETTLTMADKTRFWEFRGYAKNISDTVVSGTTFSIPENWGFILENNDEYFRSCYFEHPTVGLTDLFGIGRFSVKPGVTQTVLYKDVWQLGFECTPPERTYLMFYILIDQINFEEFFQREFFVDEKADNSQILNPLTRSLFKKRELFRPAIINFTN